MSAPFALHPPTLPPSAPRRLANPLTGVGHGVLQAAQRDIVLLSLLRKQLARYAYAGGVCAYTCFKHMRTELLAQEDRS